MISEADRYGSKPETTQLGIGWRPNCPEADRQPEDHVLPEMCFIWLTLYFFLIENV